jgi:NADP-dependent 3-hydroxy acid dehydrogenase YdfG
VIEDTSPRGIAIVTGASSGIGAATVRRLAAEGFHVVAAARRAGRLAALAEESTAITAVRCDVTSDADVARLADAVRAIRGPATLLVNNAGGAHGLDPIESGRVDDWQWMYDVNVLGTLRVTQALLPELERGGAGTIVVMSSTAGLIVYEGGGGYTAAKHAQTALADPRHRDRSRHGPHRGVRAGTFRRRRRTSRSTLCGGRGAARRRGRR